MTAPAAPGTKKTAPPKPGGATQAPATPPPPQEPEYVPLEEKTAAPAPAPTEAWASYSQEELQEAEAELTKMTPKELLALRDNLSTMEATLGESNPLGEAGGISLIDLQSETGVVIKMTVRALTPIQALIDTVKMVKFASATFNFRPVSRGADFVPAGKQQSGKSSPQQQAQPDSSGKVILQSGTGVLHSIEVEPPGKDKRLVKFMVGRFEHPFGDARIRQDNGAQIICDLFDPSLGWTPEHFQEAAFYSEKDYGKLSADWEQVQKGDVKYWNVTKIHT